MNLTAALFVGGESRRMGRDKATLEIAGEPLWSRQLKKLHELSPEKILISARAKPNWCPPEIEIILDAPLSRGPLSGIVAALENLTTTHLLALAVDLPEMSAAHLKKLWAQAQPGVGILPRAGKNFEPLCAIYPAEAFSAAKKLLDVGDFSLQSLAQVLMEKNCANVYVLSEAELPLYRNANTPADLK